MPTHTPSERAKNRSTRSTQRRRNSAKNAIKRANGQPPRIAPSRKKKK
jgi:hypothetical protein